jgi:hypothetical protein
MISSMKSCLKVVAIHTQQSKRLEARRHDVLKPAPRVTNRGNPTIKGQATT